MKYLILIFTLFFLGGCGNDETTKISLKPIPLKHYSKKDVNFFSCQIFLWGKELKTSGEIKLPTPEEIIRIKHIGDQLGRSDTEYKELDALRTSLNAKLGSDEYVRIKTKLRELKKERYVLEKEQRNDPNKKEQIQPKIDTLSQLIKEKETKIEEEFLAPLRRVEEKMSEIQLKKAQMFSEIESLVDYYSIGPSDIQLIFSLNSQPNVQISDWACDDKQEKRTYTSFPKDGALQLIRNVSFEELGGKLSFKMCADSSCNLEFHFKLAATNYDKNDGKVYFSGTIIRIKKINEIKEQKRFGVVQLIGLYKD